MRKLVEAGADVDVEDDLGESALAKAIQNPCNPSSEIIRILIDAGADVNAETGFHGSLLNAAITLLDEHFRNGLNRGDLKMAGRIHKGQLIDMVAESLGCSKAQAAESVNAVLDNIGRGLSENDRITLTGFGTFEMRDTSPRRVRLIAGPNAGQLVEVPAGKRVAFVASSGLSDIVRSGRA